MNDGFYYSSLITHQLQNLCRRIPVLALTTRHKIDETFRQPMLPDEPHPCCPWRLATSLQAGPRQMGQIHRTLQCIYQARMRRYPYEIFMKWTLISIMLSYRVAQSTSSCSLSVSRLSQYSFNSPVRCCPILFCCESSSNSASSSFVQVLSRYFLNRKCKRSFVHDSRLIGDRKRLLQVRRLLFNE